MLEGDLTPALRECGRRQENSGHEDRNVGLEHGAVPSELGALPSWPGRKLLPQHDDTPVRRLPRHRPLGQCGIPSAAEVAAASHRLPRRRSITSRDPWTLVEFFVSVANSPPLGRPCLIRDQSARPALRKVCPDVPTHARISLISGNNLPLCQPGRPMRRVRPLAAT